MFANGDGELAMRTIPTTADIIGGCFIVESYPHVRYDYEYLTPTVVEASQRPTVLAEDDAASIRSASQARGHSVLEEDSRSTLVVRERLVLADGAL
jgi:hypothetical protein